MLLFKDQKNFFGDIPWDVTKIKKRNIFKGLTGNGQMKEECARDWDCLQKILGFPLNAETIKKAHKMMGKGGGI